MNSLRKIPLEGLIQILTNLFETGADFIDISGEQDNKKKGAIDVIKITVLPEYMSEDDKIEMEIEMTIEKYKDKLSLSEDDINELM